MTTKRRVWLGIPGRTAGMYDIQFHVGGKAEERLARAFDAIIRACAQQVKRGFFHEHRQQLFAVSYVLHEAGLFDPETAKWLRELHEAICGAIDKAGDDGKDEGSSLLRQLAAGAVTVRDFNEATITGESHDG